MTALGPMIRDRYEVIQPLGRQAGRRTLLATDRETGDRVVLKLLHFSSDFQWDDLKLFEREATTLQALSHPAIPRYLDHFELHTPEMNGFVLVQSYLEARSLQDHLKAGRTFSEEELRGLAIALLEILQYLHGRQPPVIHRDIKPSNILLAEAESGLGQVYLVDFGSVQTLAAREGGTVTVVGTYGYMPPEQFGGRSVPASDLYSLGATLIYLATGQHPADLPQTDLRIEFESQVHLSLRLIRWLKRMAEPSLNRRFSSAQAALEGLSEFHPVESLAITQKPAGSRIQLKKTTDTLEVVLPAVGWNTEVMLLIPFAIAWNSFLIQAVVLGLQGGVFFLLFSLPFWMAGGFMVLKILTTLFQQTYLNVTPEQVSLTYRMLGFEYSPARPIPRAAVQKLTRGHQFPIGNLTLWAGVQRFSLGNMLSEPELEWLTHELSEWLELPVTTP